MPSQVSTVQVEVVVEEEPVLILLYFANKRIVRTIVTPFLMMS